MIILQQTFIDKFYKILQTSSKLSNEFLKKNSNQITIHYSVTNVYQQISLRNSKPLETSSTKRKPRRKI